MRLPFKIALIFVLIFAWASLAVPAEARACGFLARVFGRCGGYAHGPRVTYYQPVPVHYYRPMQYVPTPAPAPAPATCPGGVCPAPAKKSHCACGCVETGVCVCPNCDTPMLTPPVKSQSLSR